MNVKEIIEEWLKKHGYDGLCSVGCGCEIGDLMPCSNHGECQPGYKRPCRCKESAKCECEEHIGIERPEKDSNGEN